ncbi:MAG TPA: peptidoglycan-binding domain-containing protein [Luteimonas sp.]|nr:peptidoglycan-binding domain-containing protein [Luteimonas sp.]
MEFPVYVQRELEIGGAPAKGATGADVRRVQEWLSLQDCATAVDGQFGPATEAAVRRFQRLAGLRENGRVDRDTWAALNAPMRRVLGVSDAGPGAQLTDTVLALAGLHLAQHPREVGGDNRGPWVRLYMSGAQGPKHYWCAGFVSFLLRQACLLLERPMPLPGSQSCDQLAAQARQRGLFVRGTEVASGAVSWQDLGTAPIFLVRRTSTDWTHTGFAHGGRDTLFSTIEGNTNDDGSSNGYEVCARIRALAKMDFIRLPA